MNYVSIMMLIRLCESETLAQLFLEHAINEAIIAEREACAAECERMVMYPRGKQEAPAHDNVWAAAKAIRERGEKK